jgi:hypothetical protein
MTQMDLIGLCFQYLNSFKRHRALEQVKRKEGQHDQANYHELQQYKMIDQLELALRAIQKGQREIDEESA